MPATPWLTGETATLSTVSPGFKMLRGLVGHGAFPPDEQLAVVTLATSTTAEHDGVASPWSLDDLAATLVNQHAHEAMRRSTIWRVRHEADLKPHRRVYWLNSHDPDFDAKAQAIGRLYVQSPSLYQQGELVIRGDEKTGMHILQRKYPTQLAQPGKPEKRAPEYSRHGPRALSASFVVPPGEVVWDLGVTHTSRAFAAHRAHVAARFADQRRFHWVLDNLNTHWSLDVWELMARLNGVPFHKRSRRTGAERRTFLTAPNHQHVFPFTPQHGSWLNQVERWFRTLARRWLQRGDFASAADFGARLPAYLDDYNTQRAHP